MNKDIINSYTENEYRDEKKYIERNLEPDELIELICEIEGEKVKKYIRYKYNRDRSQIRALIIYGLRILCGYTFKKIGEYIGNMSLSGIRRLSLEGFRLCQENEKYREIIRKYEYQLCT